MCSRPKLTVLETILLRNAGAAKRAYALSPCSDVPPNGFGFASHCRVSPTKGYSTPSVCSRPKPFGEKAIRRGSATKPNDFAPIQFAAASPKKFSACCILQLLLAKSFGRNARCSMLSQKFWTRCKMQRHYHKNCSGNALCCTLPQDSLDVHCSA